MISFAGHRFLGDCVVIYKKEGLPTINQLYSILRSENWDINLSWTTSVF
jgi:hypothetical protein